jgi:hypothetical protein
MYQIPGIWMREVTVGQNGQPYHEGIITEPLFPAIVP